MFEVFYTNFGYSSQNLFQTFSEALSFAKEKGFDVQILFDGKVKAIWTYFGGLRMMEDY